jgi:hypothetical protein
MRTSIRRPRLTEAGRTGMRPTISAQVFLAARWSGEVDPTGRKKQKFVYAAGAKIATQNQYTYNNNTTKTVSWDHSDASGMSHVSVKEVRQTTEMSDLEDLRVQFKTNGDRFNRIDSVSTYRLAISVIDRQQVFRAKVELVPL